MENYLRADIDLHPTLYLLLYIKAFNMAFVLSYMTERVSLSLFIPLAVVAGLHNAEILAVIYR